MNSSGEDTSFKSHRILFTNWMSHNLNYLEDEANYQITWHFSSDLSYRGCYENNLNDDHKDQKVLLFVSANGVMSSHLLYNWHVNRPTFWSLSNTQTRLKENCPLQQIPKKEKSWIQSEGGMMGPVLNLRNRTIFKVIISVSPQFSVSISYKYIVS